MEDLIKEGEVVRQLYGYEDFAVVSSGRIIAYGRETKGGNGNGKFISYRQPREVKIGSNGRFQLLVPDGKGGLTRKQYSIKKSMKDHFPELAGGKK